MDKYIYVAEKWHEHRAPSGRWSKIKHEREFEVRDENKQECAVGDNTAKWWHARRQFSYGPGGCYVSYWSATEPSMREERIREDIKQYELPPRLLGFVKTNLHIEDPRYTTPDGTLLLIRDADDKPQTVRCTYNLKTDEITKG